MEGQKYNCNIWVHEQDLAALIRALDWRSDKFPSEWNWSEVRQEDDMHLLNIRVSKLVYLIMLGRSWRNENEKSH